MEGVISSYRRGVRTQNTKHMIILVDGIDNREKAEKLVGKKVEWNAPGKNKKILTGKVASAHGRKGAVRAIFETGMPGQAIGQKVKLN